MCVVCVAGASVMYVLSTCTSSIYSTPAVPSLCRITIVCPYKVSVQLITLSIWTVYMYIVVNRYIIGSA